MRYLTTSELVYINGRVLNNEKILRGEQRIREFERLEAAVARPAASAFGADAYPTLAEKAAVLLHSVARNHPFADGNKRTATIGSLFLLAVNGFCVVWKPEAALQIVLDVAEGRMDYAAFAQWLPLVPCPGLPEPDLAQDAACVNRLLDDHRWLLNELAIR